MSFYPLDRASFLSDAQPTKFGIFQILEEYVKYSKTALGKYGEGRPSVRHLVKVTLTNQSYSFLVSCMLVIQSITRHGESGVLIAASATPLSCRTGSKGLETSCGPVCAS